MLVTAVKISISLDEADVAFLDAEQAAGRFSTRSAAIRAALTLLRANRLADDYAAAFAEWDDAAWDTTSADGIGSA